MITETINTNQTGMASEILDLTNETLLTLYIGRVSGRHDNHRVGIKVSPDGTSWHELPGLLVGVGVITYQCVAVKARVFVDGREGAASQSKYHLIAR